jgi:hypothetical protein
MYTYLIFDKLSKLTKIGKTKDLKSRLSTLSTGNLNLEIVLFSKGDFENECHVLFKDKKVDKEWFNLSLEDVEGIEEIFFNKTITNE